MYVGSTNVLFHLVLKESLQVFEEEFCTQSTFLETHFPL